ncbi:hypothetical protein SEA_MUSETTA_98 [Microbacterium phage Musetta]|nr:hypothetical protein SEA_MUSETTA_98 [Microbacterium phage Musetta]QYC54218.1 hypothetical protein SEA_WELCOME_101 [Microbacterium phage Welcome]WNO25989.1 hypothetical protein SEA_ASEGATO_97 [Microbacterium phage ASegato]
MSEPTRLEALYEELADTRATLEGVELEAMASISIAEFDSHMVYAESLTDEENGLIREIESLGGEDPEL